MRLAQDKVRAAEDALVDELRKQYPVEIDEAALGQVKVEKVEKVVLPRVDGGAP